MQQIHLSLAFIRSSKGADAFLGRPSKVKFRTAIARRCNYTMGNIDVAHRLIFDETLPICTGLSSQQSLAFRFFTLLITNACRVLTLFIHKNLLVSRLTRARSGDFFDQLCETLNDNYLDMKYFTNLLRLDG